MKKHITLICLIAAMVNLVGCSMDNLSISSDNKSSNIKTSAESNDASVDMNTTSATVGSQSVDNINEGKIKLPYSSSEMKGKDYDNLTNDLKELGFTNINYDVIDDLIIGLLKSDGEVEEVSINGETDFSDEDYFAKDSEIIISYHTFPEYDSSEVDTTENKAVNEVLTVDNCSELASILSNSSEMDPSYESFSQKYRGSIIKFNGRIDYISNHDNYDTRYDFLVSAGDYDPDHQIGPTFKLENISSSNFSSVKSNSLVIGDNVVISATVGTYDAEHGIFYLEYPEISDRQ